MSTQDLYGLKSNDLEAARTAVEECLKLTLEPRHGTYRGGDYYSARLPGRDEIILQINHDGEEGGFAEEGYQEFGILLSVFSQLDGDRYKQSLACTCSRFIPLERSVTTSARVLRRMRYVDGQEEVYFEKQLDSV